MGAIGLRTAAAIVGATATAAIAFVFVAAGDTGRPKVASRAVIKVSCEQTLLHDWSDGRIDGVYPVRCYRAALKSLPADLEIYSSASEDIAHALSKRIVQSASARTKPTRKLTR